MPEEKDKLEKSEGSALAPKRSLFAGKKVGIASKIAEAKTTYDPAKMENRIGVIFDDSGSMSNTTQAYNHNDPKQVRTTKIDDAKEGTKEFFKACNLNTTSCALYGFSPERKYHLSCDIVALSLFPDSFQADQGTPLYATIKEMFDKEDVNRVIVFSDGEPTDYGHEEVILQAQEKKVPIDTVFIGNSSHGEQILKDLAEKTGGMFLKFSDSLNFRKNFKYLAPAFRGYLADPNFKKQIGAE